MVLMPFRRAEERGRGSLDPVEKMREGRNVELAMEWKGGDEAAVGIAALTNIFERKNWVLDAQSGAFVGWHPGDLPKPEASPPRGFHLSVVHALNDGPDTFLGLGALGSRMVYWRIDESFDLQDADSIYTCNTLPPEEIRPTIPALVHSIFNQYGLKELAGGLVLVDSNGNSHEVGGPDWALPAEAAIEAGFRVLSMVGAAEEAVRRRDFPYLEGPSGPVEVVYDGRLLSQRLFRPANRPLQPTEGDWDALMAAFPPPDEGALET